MEELPIRKCCVMGGGTFRIGNHRRILVTEHWSRLIECFALFAAYSPPFSDSTWRQFVHVAKQYKILQKYLKFLGVSPLDFSQKWWQNTCLRSRGTYVEQGGNLFRVVTKFLGLWTYPQIPWTLFFSILHFFTSRLGSCFEIDRPKSHITTRFFV